VRVVDITGWFSKGAGGIKTYYQAKSRALAALGVDCHFVVPAAQNGDEPFGAGTLHRIAGPTVPGDGNYHFMVDLLRLSALLCFGAAVGLNVAAH